MEGKTRAKHTYYVGKFGEAILALGSFNYGRALEVVPELLASAPNSSMKLLVLIFMSLFI